MLVEFAHLGLGIALFVLPSAIGYGLARLGKHR